MGETAISWTHRPGTIGRTWNPVQGCRIKSEGCHNCYAMRMARRFAKDGWSKGLVDPKTGVWTGETRVAAHKLAEPFGWRQPSTVFTNSMSDLFYEEFTNEEIAAVFGVMAATPRHTYIVLTKRADRMEVWFRWLDERVERRAAEWSARECSVSIHDARDVCRVLFLLECARDAAPTHHKGHLVRAIDRDDDTATWPLPNVWLGVSAENQKRFDERYPHLLRTPAAVRMFSLEPLLGPITLVHMFAEASHCESIAPIWVVAGAESGHGARHCEVNWLRTIRDECAQAEETFFLKQAESNSTERAVYPGTGADRVVTNNIVPGPGSRMTKNVIELPYLDGKQHKEWPV